MDKADFIRRLQLSLNNATAAPKKTLEQLKQEQEERERKEKEKNKAE